MTIIFNGATYYLSDYLNFIKFSFTLAVVVMLIQSLYCVMDYPARQEDCWILKYKKTTLLLFFVGCPLWFLWFK